MSFKLGVAGEENTGKSYSQTTIEDGENVFVLMPSLKATYVTTSAGELLKPFDIVKSNGDNFKTIMQKNGAPNASALIDYWNKELPQGAFKQQNLTGNIQQVDLYTLPIWIEFVSKHLPWIKTLILPDFTHYISAIISKDDFIARKAGGDSFQKFWELAGKSLNNFIIGLDHYRHDLLIITEYHAEFNDTLLSYNIYMPAGKMLTEKFKIPSYYDYLFFTDVKIHNEGEDTERAEYRFVTRSTRKYPKARAMNKFTDTYIPNDLALVIKTVRESLGI